MYLIEKHSELMRQNVYRHMIWTEKTFKCCRCNRNVRHTDVCSKSENKWVTVMFSGLNNRDIAFGGILAMPRQKYFDFSYFYRTVRY